MGISRKPEVNSYQELLIWTYLVNLKLILIRNSLFGHISYTEVNSY